MSIQVEGLCFHYEVEIPILENLSFSVEKGEFIGIFGPNGGGKTTLLQLLLGELKPKKGSVKVLGASPKEISYKIGYVPQVRRYDKQFPLSTLDVVLQGCLYAHKGWGSFSSKLKKKGMEALEKVELQDLAHRPFGTLSGGQIQRTLIARALAADPELLFLDEATVGIDPQALSTFYRLLLTLKKSITILFVTHDLKGIAQEMDSLYCIEKTITPYTPSEICAHFALGLYHPKLGKKGGKDV